MPLVRAMAAATRRTSRSLPRPLRANENVELSAMQAESWRRTRQMTSWLDACQIKGDYNVKRVELPVPYVTFTKAGQEGAVHESPTPAPVYDQIETIRMDYVGHEDPTKRTVVEVNYGKMVDKTLLTPENSPRITCKSCRVWQMSRMPELTEEGYRVLVYRLIDTDYTKFLFGEAVKAFCMVNDVIISEDKLVEGYVVVFDMKGVSVGHLARVNLGILRTFMVYIQEAHPVRLKAIHVVNTASFINHVMRLLTPLIRSELLNLIRFHAGPIPEGMPPRLMPVDYGGSQPTMQDLHASQYKLMMEKYSDWLPSTCLWTADESKRPKKQSFFSALFKSSPARSLRTLEID